MVPIRNVPGGCAGAAIPDKFERFRLTQVLFNSIDNHMQKEVKKVLAVVNDLFFSVKITDAAKRAGLALEFVKDGTELMEKAKHRPALIILDLNFEPVEPIQTIVKLKGSPETKGINLIGYLSHVQVELKVQAQDAGCDMVLARSAFSQSMPQIFKRYTGML